jgi:hypothetical protein
LAREALRWRGDAGRANHGGTAHDIAGRAIAIIVVSGAMVLPALMQAISPSDPRPASRERIDPASGPLTTTGRETLATFYAGLPVYYRSDLRLQRPDGTDITLKRMGWDGDAFYPPIDGGVRSISGGKPFAFSVDFLHNKAIARLGRGSHGRRISNGVIEEVEATGTLAGRPAPARVKLTDIFERMEFTHGHNMLYATPIFWFGSWTPRLRPYIGGGPGVALPHVEVWFPGGKREDRTNEYQFAGPAWHILAGIEYRVGNMSYTAEYRFSYAWISGALTGAQSWMNWFMPGDLWRQFGRWWRQEPPKFGRISTTLAAHQVVFGVGYWIQGKR